METNHHEEDKLWSGSDYLPELFAMLIESGNHPFLSRKRVVVHNDPALVKVFGKGAVDRYEWLMQQES